MDDSKNSTSILEYPKRILKNVVFGAVSGIKELMPLTTATVENNREAAQKLYRDTLNTKQHLQKLKNLQDSYIFKPAKELIKNIKTDLKSGNFYHPDRAQAAEEAAMGEMMKSLLGDAGLDEDLGDILTGEEEVSDAELKQMTVAPVREITTGDAIIAGSVAREQRLATHSLVSVQHQIAEAQLQTTRTLGNLTMKQLEKQTDLMEQGFGLMSQGFNALIEYNNDALTQHIKNSTQYYTNMTQLTQENNAILKELIEMKRNVYKKQVEGGEEPSSHQIKSGLFANGVLNLTEYMKLIEKNAEGSVLGQLPLMAAGIQAMIATIISNPLHEATKYVTTSLLGPGLRLAMKKIDRSITGFISVALTKLADWGYNPKSGIIGEIGKLLGVRMKRIDVREVNMAKNIKGPRSWDAEDHFYLTKVIPSYLSNIEAGITGNDARIFDSRSGRFNTVGNLVEKAKMDEDTKADQATGMLQQQIKDALYTLFKFDENDKESLSKMNSYIKQAVRGMYKKGGLPSSMKEFLENPIFGTNQNVKRVIYQLFDNVMKTSGGGLALEGDIKQIIANDNNRKSKGELNDEEAILAMNADLQFKNGQGFSIGDLNNRRITESIRSDEEATHSLLEWQEKIYNVLVDIRDYGSMGGGGSGGYGPAGGGGRLSNILGQLSYLSGGQSINNIINSIGSTQVAAGAGSLLSSLSSLNPVNSVITSVSDFFTNNPTGRALNVDWQNFQNFLSNNNIAQEVTAAAGNMDLGTLATIVSLYETVTAEKPRKVGEIAAEARAQEAKAKREEKERKEKLAAKARKRITEENKGVRFLEDMVDDDPFGAVHLAQKYFIRSKDLNMSAEEAFIKGKEFNTRRELFIDPQTGENTPLYETILAYMRNPEDVDKENGFGQWEEARNARENAEEGARSKVLKRAGSRYTVKEIEENEATVSEMVNHASANKEYQNNTTLNNQLYYEHRWLDSILGSDMTLEGANAKIDEELGSAGAHKYPFLKQLAMAGSIGAKFGVISANISKLTTAPRTILTSVLHSADKMMYEFMFGSEEHQVQGRPVRGLLDKMVLEMEKTFDNLNDKVSTLADKVFEKKDQVKDKLNYFIESHFGFNPGKTLDEIFNKHKGFWYLNPFATDVKKSAKEVGGGIIDAINGTIQDVQSLFGMAPPPNRRRRAKGTSYAGDDNLGGEFAFVSPKEAIIYPKYNPFNPKRDEMPDYGVAGTQSVEKGGLTFLPKGSAVIPSKYNPFNPDRDKANIQQDAINEARMEEKFNRKFPHYATGDSLVGQEIEPGVIDKLMATFTNNIPTDVSSILSYFLHSMDKSDAIQLIQGLAYDLGAKPKDIMEFLGRISGKGLKKVGNALEVSDDEKDYLGNLLQRLWRDDIVRRDERLKDFIRSAAKGAGYEGKFASEDELRYEEYNDREGIFNGSKQFLAQAMGKDPGRALEETRKYIIHNTPEMMKGGMIGALTGTLFPLGGPIFGAIGGVVSSLLANNKSFMEYIFGKEVVKADGTTGRDESGLISAKFVKSLEKYLPDAKKYGITGTLLGLVTPFGPLGGLMAGFAASYIKNNQSAQRFLFGGDEDSNSGIFSRNLRAKIKKALPRMGATMLGTLFLGPFGILGNAALGAGIGFVSTTEAFKKIMLGAKGRDGIRRGGLAGAIQRHVINPIKNNMKLWAKDFGKWLRNDLVKPIARAAMPIGRYLAHGIKDSIKYLWDSITEKIGGPGSAFEKLFNRLFYGIKKSGGFSKWLLKNSVGFLGSAIGSGIGKIGDVVRGWNYEKGNTGDETAVEVLNQMKRMNYTNDRYYNIYSRIAELNAKDFGLTKNDAYMADLLNMALGPEGKRAIRERKSQAYGYLTSGINEHTANSESLSDHHVDLLKIADEMRDMRSSMDIDRVLTKLEDSLHQWKIVGKDYDDIMKLFMKEAVELRAAAAADEMQRTGLTASHKEAFAYLKELFGSDLNDEQFKKLLPTITKALKNEVRLHDEFVESSKKEQEESGNVANTSLMNGTSTGETAAIKKYQGQVISGLELTNRLLASMAGWSPKAMDRILNYSSSGALDLRAFNVIAQESQTVLNYHKRKNAKERAEDDQDLDTKAAAVHAEETIKDYSRENFRRVLGMNNREYTSTFIKLGKARDIGNDAIIQSFEKILEIDVRRDGKLFERIAQLTIAGLNVPEEQYEIINDLPETGFNCALELVKLGCTIGDFRTFADIEDDAQGKDDAELMIQIAATKFDLMKDDGELYQKQGSEVFENAEVIKRHLRSKEGLTARHVGGNKAFIENELMGDATHPYDDKYKAHDYEKGLEMRKTINNKLNAQDYENIDKINADSSEVSQMTGEHQGLVGLAQKGVRLAARTTKGAINLGEKALSTSLNIATGTFGRDGYRVGDQIANGLRMTSMGLRDSQFMIDRGKVFVYRGLTYGMNKAIDMIRSTLGSFFELIGRDIGRNPSHISEYWKLCTTIWDGGIKLSERSLIKSIVSDIQKGLAPFSTTEANELEDNEVVKPYDERQTGIGDSMNGNPDAYKFPQYAGGTTFSNLKNMALGYFMGSDKDSDNKKEETENTHEDTKGIVDSLKNFAAITGSVFANNEAIDNTRSNAMTSGGEIDLGEDGHTIVNTPYGPIEYVKSSVDGQLMAAHTKANSETLELRTKDEARKDRIANAIEEMSTNIRGGLGDFASGFRKKATGSLFDLFRGVISLPGQILEGMATALFAIPIIGGIAKGILSPIAGLFGKFKNAIFGSATSTAKAIGSTTSKGIASASKAIFGFLPKSAKLALMTLLSLLGINAFSASSAEAAVPGGGGGISPSGENDEWEINDKGEVVPVNYTNPNARDDSFFGWRGTLNSAANFVGNNLLELGAGGLALAVGANAISDKARGISRRERYIRSLEERAARIKANTNLSDSNKTRLLSKIEQQMNANKATLAQSSVFRNTMATAERVLPNPVTWAKRNKRSAALLTLLTAATGYGAKTIYDDSNFARYGSSQKEIEEALGLEGGHEYDAEASGIGPLSLRYQTLADSYIRNGWTQEQVTAQLKHLEKQGRPIHTGERTRNDERMDYIADNASGVGEYLWSLPKDLVKASLYDYSVQALTGRNLGTYGHSLISGTAKTLGDLALGNTKVEDAGSELAWNIGLTHGINVIANRITNNADASLARENAELRNIMQSNARNPEFINRMREGTKDLTAKIAKETDPTKLKVLQNQLIIRQQDIAKSFALEKKLLTPQSLSAKVVNTAVGKPLMAARNFLTTPVGKVVAVGGLAAYLGSQAFHAFETPEETKTREEEEAKEEAQRQARIQARDRRINELPQLKSGQRIEQTPNGKFVILNENGTRERIISPEQRQQYVERIKLEQEKKQEGNTLSQFTHDIGIDKYGWDGSTLGSLLGSGLGMAFLRHNKITGGFLGGLAGKLIGGEELDSQTIKDAYTESLMMKAFSKGLEYLTGPEKAPEAMARDLREITTLKYHKENLQNLRRNALINRIPYFGLRDQTVLAQEAQAEALKNFDAKSDWAKHSNKLQSLVEMEESFADQRARGVSDSEIRSSKAYKEYERLKAEYVQEYGKYDSAEESLKEKNEKIQKQIQEAKEQASQPTEKEKRLKTAEEELAKLNKDVKNAKAYEVETADAEEKARAHQETKAAREEYDKKLKEVEKLREEVKTEKTSIKDRIQKLQDQIKQAVLGSSEKPPKDVEQQNQKINQLKDSVDSSLRDKRDIEAKLKDLEKDSKQGTDQYEKYQKELEQVKKELRPKQLKLYLEQKRLDYDIKTQAEGSIQEQQTKLLDKYRELNKSVTQHIENMKKLSNTTSEGYRLSNQILERNMEALRHTGESLKKLGIDPSTLEKQYQSRMNSLNYWRMQDINARKDLSLYEKNGKFIRSQIATYEQQSQTIKGYMERLGLNTIAKPAETIMPSGVSLSELEKKRAELLEAKSKFTEAINKEYSSKGASAVETSAKLTNIRTYQEKIKEIDNLLSQNDKEIVKAQRVVEQQVSKLPSRSISDIFLSAKDARPKPEPAISAGRSMRTRPSIEQLEAKENRLFDELMSLDKEKTRLQTKAQSEGVDHSKQIAEVDKRMQRIKNKMDINFERMLSTGRSMRTGSSLEQLNVEDVRPKSESAISTESSIRTRPSLEQLNAKQNKLNYDLNFFEEAKSRLQTKAQYEGADYSKQIAEVDKYIQRTRNKIGINEQRITTESLIGTKSPLEQLNAKQSKLNYDLNFLEEAKTRLQTRAQYQGVDYSKQIAEIDKYIQSTRSKIRFNEKRISKITPTQTESTPPKTTQSINDIFLNARESANRVQTPSRWQRFKAASSKSGIAIGLGLMILPSQLHDWISKDPRDIMKAKPLPEGYMIISDAEGTPMVVDKNTMQPVDDQTYIKIVFKKRKLPPNCMIIMNDNGEPVIVNHQGEALEDQSSLTEEPIVSQGTHIEYDENGKKVQIDDQTGQALEDQSEMQVKEANAGDYAMMGVAAASGVNLVTGSIKKTRFINQYFANKTAQIASKFGISATPFEGGMFRKTGDKLLNLSERVGKEGIIKTVSNNKLAEVGTKGVEKLAQESAFAQTVLTKSKDILDKFYAIVGKLVSPEMLEGIKAIGAHALKLMTRPEFMQKIMALALKQAATVSLGIATMGIGAAVLTGAFAITGFYAGWNHAEEMLDIPNGKATLGMKIFCGTMSALTALPVVGLLFFALNETGATVKIFSSVGLTKLFGFDEETLRSLRKEDNDFKEEGEYKSWEEAKDAFSSENTLTWAKKSVKGIFSAVIASASSTASAIYENASKAVQGIASFATTAKDYVADKAANVGKTIGEWARSGYETLKTKADAGWQAAKEYGSKAVEVGKNVLGKVGNFFMGLVPDIDTLKNGKNNLSGKGKSSLQSLGFGNNYVQQTDPDVANIKLTAPGDTFTMYGGDRGCQATALTNAERYLGYSSNHVSNMLASAGKGKNYYSANDGSSPDYSRDLARSHGLQAANVDPLIGLQTLSHQPNTSAVVQLNGNMMSPQSREEMGLGPEDAHYVTLTNRGTFIDPADESGLGIERPVTPDMYGSMSNMTLIHGRGYKKNKSIAKDASFSRKDMISIKTKYGRGYVSAEKMWALANWVSQRTNIDPKLLYGQWYHESDAFDSPLVRSNYNFGGVTQAEPNDTPQPDGNCYYIKFDSPEDYAEYFATYINHPDWPQGFGGSVSAEDYAHRLKLGGYYGDDEPNYLEGIKNGMKFIPSKMGQIDQSKFKGRTMRPPRGLTGNTAATFSSIINSGGGILKVISKIIANVMGVKTSIEPIGNSRPLNRSRPISNTNTLPLDTKVDPNDIGSKVVAAASAMVDKVPYVYGGEGPDGVDCSGLVSYIYKKFGLYNIPRIADAQYDAFKAVNAAHSGTLQGARPGDAVFSRGSDPGENGVGHVGIYIGNNKMIEAQQTGTNVLVSDANRGLVGYGDVRAYAKQSSASGKGRSGFGKFGRNAMHINSQSGPSCTLEATKTMFKAYKDEDVDPWYTTWARMLDNMPAKEMDFWDRASFENFVSNWFSAKPENPLFLYQTNGAGNRAENVHALNRVSGNHATVIGRKTASGQYEVYDSNGGIVHTLELSQIYDDSAKGGTQGMKSGNALWVPSIDPSSKITQWMTPNETAGPQSTPTNANSAKPEEPKNGGFMGKLDALIQSLNIYGGLVGSSSTTNTPSQSNTNLDNIKSQIWNHLAPKYGPVAAASIMGNMDAESSFDPTVVNGDGGATGLCQWYDVRERALKDFANSKGKPWQDVQTQLEFLDKEIAESYSSTIEKMKDKSIEDAAIIWEKDFEASGNESSYSRRKQSAREIYNRFHENKQGKGKSFGSCRKSLGKGPDFAITPSYSMNTGSNVTEKQKSDTYKNSTYIEKTPAAQKAWNRLSSAHGPVVTSVLMSDFTETYDNPRFDFPMKRQGEYKEFLRKMHRDDNLDSQISYLSRLVSSSDQATIQNMKDSNVSTATEIWYHFYDPQANAQAKAVSAKRYYATYTGMGQAQSTAGMERDAAQHSTSNMLGETDHEKVNKVLNGEPTTSNNTSNEAPKKEGWLDKVLGGVGSFFSGAKSIFSKFASSVGGFIMNSPIGSMLKMIFGDDSQSKFSLFSGLNLTTPTADKPKDDTNKKEEDKDNKDKTLSDIKAPNGEMYTLNDIKYLTDQGYTQEQAIQLLSKVEKYTKKKEEEKDKKDNTLSDIKAPNGEMYTLNDIKYLTDQGYTQAQAIQLLSKNYKYQVKKEDRKELSDIKAPNGSSYEINDIKYLTNKGYTQEQAIQLLSKTEKYSKKKERDVQYYINNPIKYEGHGFGKLKRKGKGSDLPVREDLINTQKMEPIDVPQEVSSRAEAFWNNTNKEPKVYGTCGCKKGVCFNNHFGLGTKAKFSMDRNPDPLIGLNDMMKRQSKTLFNRIDTLGKGRYGRFAPLLAAAAGFWTAFRTAAVQFWRAYGPQIVRFLANCWRNRYKIKLAWQAFKHSQDIERLIKAIYDIGTDDIESIPEDMLSDELQIAVWIADQLGIEVVDDVRQLSRKGARSAWEIGKLIAQEFGLIEGTSDAGFGKERKGFGKSIPKFTHKPLKKDDHFGQANERILQGVVKNSQQIHDARSKTIEMNKEVDKSIRIRRAENYSSNTTPITPIRSTTPTEREKQLEILIHEQQKTNSLLAKLLEALISGGRSLEDTIMNSMPKSVITSDKPSNDNRPSQPSSRGVSSEALITALETRDILDGYAHSKYGAGPLKGQNNGDYKSILGTLNLFSDRNR